MASTSDHILESIAVLIDREYIDEQNNGKTLRGSSNQQIRYLSDHIRRYCEPYLKAGRAVQNVTTSSGAFSIGIHSRVFQSELCDNLQKKL